MLTILGKLQIHSWKLKATLYFNLKWPIVLHVNQISRIYTFTNFTHPCFLATHLHRKTIVNLSLTFWLREWCEGLINIAYSTTPVEVHLWHRLTTLKLFTKNKTAEAIYLNITRSDTGTVNMSNKIKLWAKTIHMVISRIICLKLL